MKISRLISLLVIIAITCILVSCTSIEEKPIEVRAGNLYSAYVENEVSADLEYKDKLLLVSGKVYKIGKLTNGAPYLILDGGKSDSNLAGLLDTYGTQCQFPEDKAELIAAISKGDMVKVQGRCSGGIIRFIVINNCSLVDIEPSEASEEGESSTGSFAVGR